MNQQTSISTLQSQLEVTTDIKQRVDILNLIVDQLRYHDPEQARIYAEEARQLSYVSESDADTYWEGLIRSLLHLAYVYQWIGQYQESLELAKEALEHSEAIANKQLQAMSLVRLGLVYTRLGHYPTAYENYTLAIEIAQHLADEPIRCTALIGLGIVFATLGDFQNAIEQYQMALEIAHPLNLHVHYSLLLNNLAFALYEMGEYEGLLSYAFEAREIALANNTQVTLNLIDTIIAGAYIGLHQYEEASKFLEPNILKIHQTSDKKALSFAYQILAKWHFHTQETDKAIALLFDALQVADEIKAIDDKFEIHSTLAEMYEKEGNLERALYHYRQFHELKETVINQQSEQKLRILEVVHQTEQARQKAENYRLKTELLEQMVAERTAALTKQSDELSESLAREHALAKQLSAALKQEEELSSLKSRIIETVSHEFRTPLTVINTSAQLLQRDKGRFSPEKKNRYFQRISESIFFISNLIDDAAFLSHTSHTTLQPMWATSEVKTFCLDLESSLQGEYEHVNVLLFKHNVPKGVNIVTDNQLAYHCLANLVSNAQKYGSESGKIEVILQVVHHQLHICVQDDGIGVPLEEQQKIFELFYRGSNVGHRRGLGLGLAIVQRICRILQGEIRVKSDGEGKGSMFTLVLPLLPVVDGVG